MTEDAVVLCALWANELERLEPLGPRRSDYVLTEPSRRVAEPLAAAMGVNAPVVSERLERGCRAFVARACADTVVAWLWVSTGQEWAPPLRQVLRFAPDQCYGWNAGTLPAHRSRGLLTALLRHAGWRMAQEGYRLMWNGILDDNLPSRRAHASAGFRPVLRLTARHEPPPTRLQAWPADHADEAVVERAREVVGLPTLAEARNGSMAAAGRQR